MEEWIEEDLTLLSKEADPVRALDQRVLREPIRRLNPRDPLSLPPSATVLQAIQLMREHRVGVLVVDGGSLLA